MSSALRPLALLVAALLVACAPPPPDDTRPDGGDQQLDAGHDGGGSDDGGDSDGGHEDGGDGSDGGGEGPDHPAPFATRLVQGAGFSGARTDGTDRVAARFDVDASGLGRVTIAGAKFSRTVATKVPAEGYGFSPDGRFILLDEHATGVRHLRVTTAGPSGGAQALVQGYSGDGWLWAPNGSHLLYPSNANPDGHSNLILTTPSAQLPELVAAASLWHVPQAADGSMALVFDGVASGTTSRLRAVDLTRGQSFDLAEAIVAADLAPAGGRAAWIAGDGRLWTSSLAGEPSLLIADDAQILALSLGGERVSWISKETLYTRSAEALGPAAQVAADAAPQAPIVHAHGGWVLHFADFDDEAGRGRLRAAHPEYETVTLVSSIAPGSFQLDPTRRWLAILVDGELRLHDLGAPSIGEPVVSEAGVAPGEVLFARGGSGVAWRLADGGVLRRFQAREGEAETVATGVPPGGYVFGGEEASSMAVIIEADALGQGKLVIAGNDEADDVIAHGVSEVVVGSPVRDAVYFVIPAGRWAGLWTTIIPL